MISRFLILALVIFFAMANAEAQAIKKVSNKSKDSTEVKKTDTKDQKATLQKKQKQDEFIDKNGDGINDKMLKAKQPAVKKQQAKSQAKASNKQSSAKAKQTQSKTSNSSSGKDEDTSSKKSKR